MGRKFYVTDCEGPISTNDNAFELSGYYIEEGEKFFQIISRYDDILVDVVKRPGYNAGDTLKLIVPFLKAYGATNKGIQEFSSQNVLLIPGASQTLKYVQRIMPSFIVSTSYQQYIQALCDIIHFPVENTYSTTLDLESQSLSKKEEERLKELRNIIIKNPDFEVLDQIFWEEIPSLEIGKIMEKVKTVGGEGKKEALLDIMSKHNLKSKDMMYIGDSITDVEPLKYANEQGGLAISFNGNEFAIREAQIAIMSKNTRILTLLADLFNYTGTDDVLEFVQVYSQDPQGALDQYSFNKGLISSLKRSPLPRMSIITCDNQEELMKQSTAFRKKVRGEAIGGLG